MTILVIWLFFETKRAVDRERRASHDGRVTNTLRKERCTYAIVSILFALSYVGRVGLNEYEACSSYINEYGYEMAQVTTWLFEGVSMGVLMGFHFVNFNSDSSLLSDREQSFALIPPEEFSRFDTEEIETRDRSTFAI